MDVLVLLYLRPRVQGPVLVRRDSPHSKLHHQLWLKHVANPFLVSDEASSSKTIAPIFNAQKRKAPDADSSPTNVPSRGRPRASEPHILVQTPTKSVPPPTKRPKPMVGTADRMAAVAPLADRMRPQTLDDYVGQEPVVGKGSMLRGLLDSGQAGSLILVSCSLSETQ